MKNDLYTFTCPSCKKVFMTDTQNQEVCSTCLKYRKPHKPKTKKKKKKCILTFAQILHIADVYYAVNKKYLHYGDVVHLVESNAEHCVCCGATIPEGRQICLQCEKVGEK